MPTPITRWRLPDPYSPMPAGLDELLAVAWSASGTWSSANGAVFMPFQFPVSATIYSVSFWANNGTGNYDLGLYFASLARVQSKGSTAMTAAGKKTLSLTTDFRVNAGDLIYVGVVCSSTSGQIVTITSSTVLNAASGIGSQASALPLPDPFVPVSSTSTRIPVIQFGIR